MMLFKNVLFVTLIGIAVAAPMPGSDGELRYLLVKTHAEFMNFEVVNPPLGQTFKERNVDGTVSSEHRSSL